MTPTTGTQALSRVACLGVPHPRVLPEDLLPIPSVTKPSLPFHGACFSNLSCDGRCQTCSLHPPASTRSGFFGQVHVTKLPIFSVPRRQWPHAPNSRWSCSFPRLTSCETCSTPSDTDSKSPTEPSASGDFQSAEGLYEVCERANKEGSHAKPATSQSQRGTGQVLAGSSSVFLDRTNRAYLSMPGRQFGVAGDRN